MKIAQIAPLFESVPPRGYGGTERIVSWLTEELVRQGHEVTLYASGDSQTRAALRAGSPSALRQKTHYLNDLPYHIAMLEAVLKEADRFDVIHSHLDYLGFPFARRITTPFLTTIHGRLDQAELGSIYREYQELPLISISNAQRSPLEDAHWAGTIYHGLPGDLLTLGTGQGGYLAFLGRISAEKGIADAIRIAQHAGIPIKIAAKVDPRDAEYFKTVAPLIESPGVEFVGEIGDDDKASFLGNARVLLFPIDWPEPFGLVMIEAMACGTPVIAYRRGSVPEIMRDRVTGFIVDNQAQAVAAVRRVETLDRRRVRQEFETRFTATRMANDYVQLYQTFATVGIDPILG